MRTTEATVRQPRLRYLRLWGELLALSWRLYPGRSVALVAVKAASAVIVAVIALALRAAVNGIVEGNTSAAVTGAGAAALACAVTAYLGGLEVVLYFTLIEPVGLLHLNPRIQADIATLERLDHLERTDFLDRVTVLQNAAWGLMAGTWTAVDALMSVVKLVLLLTLLGTVSPWLLLLFAFAVVPIWLDRRGQRATNRAETDTAEAFRLQRHLFNLATDPAGGKEIRVAGTGEAIAGRQRAAWDEAMRVRLRARIRAAGWKLLGWTLFTAGSTAALGLVVYRTAHGQGTVGDIVLTMTVAVTLRDSIQETVFRANTAMGAGQLIEPFLWLRDHVAAERARVVGDRPAPPRLHDGITLDRVSFRYPGTDELALDDVSCRIPAGSVVAVVGEYGSGKTTLVKILCKFYEPDSGRILIDGVDLAGVDTASWRARTSAAFQDFGRFTIRFADTVGLGDLPNLTDRDRIRSAIDTADAVGLVDRLPDGLDTQLGRTFDGVDLSEGQWQKTALARASMRTEPVFFVLDEPTASLDAPSEHAIFQRYMARAGELGARTGAITVIVSHRFSTVTGADHILVLERGRLVEAGTHDELLALDGRYADLYGIQAAAYAPAR